MPKQTDNRRFLRLYIKDKIGAEHYLRRQLLEVDHQDWQDTRDSMTEKRDEHESFPASVRHRSKVQRDNDAGDSFKIVADHAKIRDFLLNHVPDVEPLVLVDFFADSVIVTQVAACPLQHQLQIQHN